MKRQFCSVCIRTTSDYTTVEYPGGRRFHFCADHRQQGQDEAAALARTATRTYHSDALGTVTIPED